MNQILIFKIIIALLIICLASLVINSCRKGKSREKFNDSNQDNITDLLNFFKENMDKIKITNKLNDETKIPIFLNIANENTCASINLFDIPKNTTLIDVIKNVYDKNNSIFINNVDDSKNEAINNLLKTLNEEQSENNKIIKVMSQLIPLFIIFEILKFKILQNIDDTTLNNKKDQYDKLDNLDKAKFFLNLLDIKDLTDDDINILKDLIFTQLDNLDSFKRNFKSFSSCEVESVKTLILYKDEQNYHTISSLENLEENQIGEVKAKAKYTEKQLNLMYDTYSGAIE